MSKRKTKTEPVKQVPSGKYITKAKGQPVDVNKKGEIVTRYVDYRLASKPENMALLKAADTEKDPVKKNALRNEWWRRMGYKDVH